MIKILFICHGTTSVCESGVGCQLGKSVQIVALWKAPYYGSANEKYICTNPLFRGQQKAPCSYAGAFFRIIANVLFRYFGKCCSDIIDIIPLKWYTISQIGGIIYVYDGKTGF